MKTSNKLWRKALLPMTTGLLLLQSATSYAARCEYVIQNEWNSGFVAAIRITNDTNTTVNGWSVSWSYTDGSSRIGGWNANFSGSNPYSASNVGWNGQINPGQTAEFGIQGNKGVQNTPAAKPTVTGAVCSGQTSSSVISSVRTSSSVSTSSKTSTSISTSSRTSTSVSTSSSSRSSSSSSSSSKTSVSTSSSVVSTSSSVVSTSSSSKTSSSQSSVPNTAPVANLQVTQYGLTVYVDASVSSDADGNTLTHTVDFGDSKTVKYPKAWHTYSEPGQYTISLSVSDGQVATTKTQQIFVQAVAGNTAPIARLTAVREYQRISAYGSSSFDREAIPLTYEWDFGDGPFAGNSYASVTDCASGETIRRTRLVTLTVSDGELKDTIQGTFGGNCGAIYDLQPGASFGYKAEGNTVFFDASKSYSETGFSWEFGDGTTAKGLLATHTYASSGVYLVKLTLSGPSLFTGSTSQTINVGFVSSPSSTPVSSSSSSSVRTSSSVATSSSSSRASSSLISSSSSSRSSSSQGSIDRNRYTAPRATTAPVIDGVVDSVWDRASWAPIDVFWLGTQSNPSAQDYTGRYKALWDENYLYILYDLIDDKIYDGVREPLDRYWEDDTVELFIDENKSGGQHGNSTNAWAYHISTYGDVVDSTTGSATLLNNHIDVRRVDNGTQHYWELRIRIYGDDYADWKTNTPLTLFAGKLMGFSACYIDNDGSSQRESMMGSVDTQGHKNNQGYLDASVFGSMLLVE